MTTDNITRFNTAAVFSLNPVSWGFAARVVGGGARLPSPSFPLQQLQPYAHPIHMSH